MRPFLTPDRLARASVDHEFLAEVIDAMHAVPIREALIRHPTKLLFGERDEADGTMSTIDLTTAQQQMRTWGR